MSNISGDELSLSLAEELQYQENQQQQQHNHLLHGSTSTPSNKNASSDHHQNQLQSTKKKRNLPGTPDPNAEVIALSPTTLMATNRFVCEVCNKGFQRDQNLQLHQRGHNLPWKLRQRASNEVRNSCLSLDIPGLVGRIKGRCKEEGHAVAVKIGGARSLDDEGEVGGEIESAASGWVVELNFMEECC